MGLGGMEGELLQKEHKTCHVCISVAGFCHMWL